YKEDTYTRGLNVYTTVSSTDQTLASKALRQGVLEYDRRRGYRGPEGFVDLPQGIEADADRLDEVIDDALAAHPDSDGLLAAVVLSASADKVVVARSSGERIEITGKQLAFVKSALSAKAQPARQIRRGAIVRVRRTGEN